MLKVLRKQLEFFVIQADDQNIKIEEEMIDPGFVISNLSLLEMLVSNLLSNAIKHNTPFGYIQIKVNNKSLTILNTGTASPLPTGKLFQRFSRMTTSTKGSGLGLAIVKKIADNYKWEVEYNFQNALHVFRIKF